MLLRSQVVKLPLGLLQPAKNDVTFRAAVTVTVAPLAELDRVVQVVLMVTDEPLTPPQELEGLVLMVPLLALIVTDPPPVPANVMLMFLAAAR